MQNERTRKLRKGQLIKDEIERVVMGEEFLIPVGMSPVPPARVALALHEEGFIPILVCTVATKNVCEKVKLFLKEQTSTVPEMIVCLGEDVNPEKDKDLFSNHKKEILKSGKNPENLLIGPGSKWFSTAIALSNPDMKYWIIAERYSKSKKNINLQRIRRISGIPKEIELRKISVNEVLILHGIHESKIIGILDSWKQNEDVKCEVNQVSGKIELRFRPKENYREWKSEKLKRKLRTWEKNLNGKRATWEEIFGTHSLIFILDEIETKSYWDRFMRRMAINRWRGGLVKCK